MCTYTYIPYIKSVYARPHTCAKVMDSSPQKHITQNINVKTVRKREHEAKTTWTPWVSGPVLPIPIQSPKMDHQSDPLEDSSSPTWYSGTDPREDPHHEKLREVAVDHVSNAREATPRETLTDPFRGPSWPSVHHSPPWLELPSSRKNPIIVIPWTRRTLYPSAAPVARLGLITVGGSCCTDNATAWSACSRACRWACSCAASLSADRSADW